jgi:hypothetical protein
VLQQGTPLGIGVPRADVAGPALPVDDGDDAAVGERRDDQLCQPAQGGLPVQRAGEFGGDLGQQRRVRRCPGGGLLGPLPVGDVEDVDGDAVGIRPCPDLVRPQLVQPAVAPPLHRLEGHRLPGGGRLPAGALETEADGLGAGLVHGPAEQLVGGPAQQALGRRVDVAEPPARVEQAEGGRHRVEDPAQIGARPPPRRASDLVHAATSACFAGPRPPTV